MMFSASRFPCRQEFASAGSIRLQIGVLKLIDHMRMQRRGVSQRLHGQRVLGDSRCPEEIRDGPRREDQVIKLNHVTTTEGSRRNLRSS